MVGSQTDVNGSRRPTRAATDAYELSYRVDSAATRNTRIPCSKNLSHCRPGQGTC